MIFSEVIWFNSILRVTVSLYIFFSDKNVNFIGQLFNDNENI